MHVRTIGFTGSIASGKTLRCQVLVHTACRHIVPGITKEEALQRCTVTEVVPNIGERPVEVALPRRLPVGVTYINADQVVHRLYQPGTPLYTEIVTAFGTGTLVPSCRDGPESPLGPPIDRRALGAIVFGDQKELARLDDLCRPYIRKAIQGIYTQRCEAGRQQRLAALLIILEASVLLNMEDVATRYCTDIWITHCTAAIAVRRIMCRDGISEELARQRVRSQPSFAEMLHRLSAMNFQGGTEVFDTAATTTVAGLAAVEDVFDRYWRENIQPHLPMGEH